MPHCEPVGVAYTPHPDQTAAPRQGADTDSIGEIEIEPQYIDAIDGLEPGRSYLVLWFAHLADPSTVQIDRGGGRGVFASRSQDRPNPICLTTVNLESIEGSTLRVRGVDMVDETPVLDIKIPLSSAGYE